MFDMVNLLLQNPILKEMLSNAEYLGSWKMFLIKVLQTKHGLQWFRKYERLDFEDCLVHFLLFLLNKVEKNLQCCSPLVLFSGIKKKYRHKCFYMVFLKITFKITYQMALFMSLDYPYSSISLSALINWLKISEQNKELSWTFPPIPENHNHHRYIFIPSS